jgi:hypothetical protein
VAVVVVEREEAVAVEVGECVFAARLATTTSVGSADA